MAEIEAVETAAGGGAMMKRFSAMTYAKAAWIFCMVAAQVLYLECLYLSPSKCPEGPGYLVVVAPFILSFPTCFCVFGLLWSLGIRDGLNDAVIWALNFVAGWVQWFIVMPWLWRKWKQWKQRRAQCA